MIQRTLVVAVLACFAATPMAYAAAPAAPVEAPAIAPAYVLPERDVRQDELDARKRRVELLRLEAEEAELLQRIAKATGDTSSPTTMGVPVLSALLTTTQGRVAYFQDGKRTVKAKVGDRIGQWIVKAFVGNAVRLEHGDTGRVYLAAIGAKSPESTESSVNPMTGPGGIVQ